MSRENENYKNQVAKRKVAEEENKKANHRNHGEWLKEQMKNLEEKKKADMEMRRNKASLFGTNGPNNYGRNSPEAASPIGIGSNSFDRENKRALQNEYKAVLDAQTEEHKRYRSGGNMT